MRSLPYKKVLVANRGEIAIRIFRSCTELGLKTVAIYSYEDRFSLHRYKADEAYQVGAKGSPVQSYLDTKAILEIARQSEAEAIHPGYGFLSEREDFAKAVEDAGLIFVGPSTETLRVAGSKIACIELANKLGIPTLQSSSLLKDFKDARQYADKIGYPVMLKSSAGGGGRGMRRIFKATELEDAFRSAQAEAVSAFGCGDMFIEKLVESPKHIEVQLFGDGQGEVSHLFERDCSIQRRSQKLIEFAPAVALDQKIKSEIHSAALKIAKAFKLKAAATAEFLVGKDNQFYFIEVNPRIQVEHTVTEEITGIDIVQSQLLVAGGYNLEQLKLTQENIQQVGTAIQCRITTEDPTKDFLPSYGKLLAYRSASGFGIRLDAGSAFTGAEITPYYDSMLVKVTARGANLEDAAARMKRAIREFRIRGVSTNIAFLENVLSNPAFLSGSARTSFLEDHSEVLVIAPRKDRANKLLRFIGDVIVNGHELMPVLPRPKTVRIPQVEALFKDYADLKIEKGWRDVFLEQGKDKFLEKVRNENKLLITDTTFRDAHQSLFATRMRSVDILKIAPYLSRIAPQLFSLEMWGGATFDVMLRFLREDPWARLEQLREIVPNILFQVLLRGANGVGYKTYPKNVIDGFVKQAYKSGIDIFRIFDSLNNIDRMNSSIDAVRNAGGIAEVCICYTGNLLETKNNKYNLDYYLNLSRQAVNAGADIIAIKDMAGLLRPFAAEVLVSALKKEFSVPVHLHTHDTAGVQTATYLQASAAGVDIVDCAFSSMSGCTSQPTLEGLVAALEGTVRDTGLDLKPLTKFSSYWENVREYYQPFESDLKSSTAEVYFNEIPGGQYSNFRPQAQSLGVGDRWEELKKAYAEVNELLGNIVKVTPSSKAIGDFAIFMVVNGLTKQDVIDRADTLDFPASVIEFFKGDLGVPQGGFPEELRKKVLRGETAYSTKLDQRLPDADMAEAEAKATELLGFKANQKDALSYLLYPVVFKEYSIGFRDFGDVSNLPTMTFFYGLEEGEEIEVDLEKGKKLFISLEAVSEPNDEGDRTVFFELNGQPRNIQIKDNKVSLSKVKQLKAENSNPAHVGAALTGMVVSLDVKVGSLVKVDQPLFSIEAMKMQSIVRSTREGKISKIHVQVGSRVLTGDLVMEIN